MDISTLENSFILIEWLFQLFTFDVKLTKICFPRMEEECKNCLNKNSINKYLVQSYYFLTEL